MLLAHEQVFDEFIVGTDATWYTSAEYNAMLGLGERLKIFAVATDIENAPSLVVNVDCSADGEHWEADPASPLISTALSADPTVVANINSEPEVTPSFRRLSVTLTGTGTPRCRLRLTVTTRSR